MSLPEPWLPVLPVLAMAIPVVFGWVALTSPRRAPAAGLIALGLALLFTLGVVLTRGDSTMGVTKFGVRLDAPTCVMLMLVGALGVVIIRASRTYLHGDPGFVRYHRWLLLTLGAVTTLVVANNLAIVALGWTATSLSLHQLLTFYGERPAARIAAHKKFLVSRLADACLVVCLTLVYRSVGSLDLDAIAAFVGAQPALTPSMEIAALFVVLAVALKSAQLPFHGWLIQVMEAPTPVSALLHAGVVNIGGFFLIRLSPWLDRAEVARLLLVVIGLGSAVVASLVMTTRVSVKVSLAWSTCAQMGFMLVQCGLGLWSLALLHLVAHSLYKAHAFLNAGSAVERWETQSLAKPRPARSGRALVVTIVAGVGAAGLCVALLSRFGTLRFDEVPVLMVLVALSLLPLLARGPVTSGAIFATGARICGVILLSAAGHAAAAFVLPEPVRTNPWGLALFSFGLLVLFALKAALQLDPVGPLARALYPGLFAGFCLDERFTRIMFRVWPPELTSPRKAPLPLPTAAALEA